MKSIRILVLYIFFTGISVLGRGEENKLIYCLDIDLFSHISLKKLREIKSCILKNTNETSRIECEEMFLELISSSKESGNERESCTLFSENLKLLEI